MNKPITISILNGTISLLKEIEDESSDMNKVKIVLAEERIKDVINALENEEN